MPATRQTFVPAQRLPGWLERFAAGNGGVAVTPEHGGLHLAAGNGTEAQLLAPWPDDGRPGRGADDVERLVSLAGQSRTVGIVLLRRGGFAVGVARDGALLPSQAGSTSVRSRGSAGGSPQRRANQTETLVEAAAGAAARLFAEHPAEYLVFGGDRALTGLFVQQLAFARWSNLSRLRPLAVQDPKPAALAQAAKDACSVLIRITVP
ncbi:hypothetical protein J2M53_07610 [Arthrobacter sp. zg-ZUI100]|uniref:Actinobacteria/chloroflexi VLRF1 release factor domain-containing protein n=1 Tax=Arthrobacter jiangjiafuii TaxID=2817475 RepID=A0A975M2X6_9MICC|nr:acVLRF1 family peptidyl-tRNA hydrolase [Arthrobacter jiangjiafuii]MBP3036115.1 hypothetical protein [Arthrobacter jiangjiafuii]MBP3043384.1 hypothetical protein [Arthrobacter jiangjiafuii]QWC08917.1 hypothetical protein KKR91_10245 [Arthrobacter jiangjiafuii]